jgi:ketosteroid isomerase-like protein
MCLFFAAILLLQHAAVPAADPSLPEITQELNTFAQRMHDKKEDAILRSYTADAVFIDPSGKRFSTSSQLRALYDQVFATFDSDLRFEQPVIVRRGHSYHTSGVFTETLRNRKTGQVQHISGRYQFNLTPFYDGHWAFTRMQWSMN